MSNASFVALGMDPGFGYFKLAWANSSPSPKNCALPSLLVPSPPSTKGTRLFATSGRRKTWEVETEGQTFLVGIGAQEQGKPLDIQQSIDRLQSAPELLPLLGAALASLGLEGSHRAVLAVGLPVELLQDSGKARKTKDRLKEQFLRRPLSFRVGRTSVQIEISSIYFLPQPAGAFFAWGLSPDGRWIRPQEDLLEARVGVCDIGFNTCDLFAVRAGEVLSRWTGGESVALRRALEILQERLYRSHGVLFSLHELDVEGILWKPQPRLHLATGMVDLKEDREQAIRTVAGDIIAFLERTWAGGRHFSYILLTGGGSVVFHDVLQRYFGGLAVSLPDALTANAQGLARYAARLAARVR